MGALRAYTMATVPLPLEDSYSVLSKIASFHLLASFKPFVTYIALRSKLSTDKGLLVMTEQRVITVAMKPLR